MNPFAVLGVAHTVTAEEARAVWREKARTLHPDVGGSDAAMQELNEALRLVLLALETKSEVTDSRTTTSSDSDQRADTSRRSQDFHRPRTHWARTSRDVSSFTIDCLPVEAFEALLIASSWHGDVAVDDAPYVLETVMRDPFHCWIRFDIVPEAGASMVSITVATPKGSPPVASEDVRDVFVDSLNQLNWEDIHS